MTAATTVPGRDGGAGGVYPGDLNWTTGSATAGRWETWAGRRGDCPSPFYMNVRYEGGTHGTTGVSEPDLVLTNDETLIAASNTGNNETLAHMGMLSVLLDWHREDPVDAKERRRNDVVHGFQGNRNPFVDRPEWADCVFANRCAGPVALSQPWINELHYDNVNLDAGEFVEVAGPAGTELAGWMLVGYNGATRSVYKTIRLSGVIHHVSSRSSPGAIDKAPRTIASICSRSRGQLVVGSTRIEACVR